MLLLTHACGWTRKPHEQLCCFTCTDAGQSKPVTGSARCWEMPPAGLHATRWPWWGCLLVGMLVFIAIFANFMAPYAYDDADPVAALQFPSAEHWMGTDEVGRDVYSRIIYGSRISLAVGLGVTAIALVIGVPLGLAAGLMGGPVDCIIMRWWRYLRRCRRCCWRCC